MGEARFLLRGRNGEIAIDGDRIGASNLECQEDLAFPHCDVLPGLINAHDHLHRNHYGRLGFPPYRSANDWGRDIHDRCSADIALGLSKPKREALLVGAWKNLFAGVTTVVHHDSWEPEFAHDFPLRVSRITTMQSVEDMPDRGPLPGEGPYAVHLAEGLDASSMEEVRDLAARGLLCPRMLGVHCIGLDEESIRLLCESGTGVVWCPSSNLYLFGKTAPAELFETPIDILLGSDSLLTGDGNLLDELRLARSIGFMSNDRLEASVGIVAARRLCLPVPSLEPGSQADLVVLARPLAEASAADVELVVVAGIPRVARLEWAACLERLGFTGDRQVVGGIERWVNPVTR